MDGVFLLKTISSYFPLILSIGFPISKPIVILKVSYSYYISKKGKKDTTYVSLREKLIGELLVFF